MESAAYSVFVVSLIQLVAGELAIESEAGDLGLPTHCRDVGSHFVPQPLVVTTFELFEFLCEVRTASVPVAAGSLVVSTFFDSGESDETGSLVVPVT